MKTKKPLNRDNYGSIPHLKDSTLGKGDRFISDGCSAILTQKTRDKHDTVLVFEKYDGSNVGIAKKDGQIIPLIRKGHDARDSQRQQHHLFADWVASKSHIFDAMLSDGDRIVGEWLAQAHGIVYDIIGDPIVFFDYFDANDTRLLFDDLKAKVAPFGLTLPRLLHRGDAVAVQNLLPILNQKTPNIRAVDLPEGMIYRVQRLGKVDFLAKWVRSDFKNGAYLPDVNGTGDVVWNNTFVKS